MTSPRPATAPDRAEAVGQFDRLLAERWSCRAFLPDAVPAATIDRMLELAQRTPSWCNTQPWHLYLLSGDATRRLSDRLVTAAQTVRTVSDFPPPAEYRGVFQERRREAGYALYESVGIDRADRRGRAEQMLRNFQFFGAPHVVIITSDRDQGVYGAVDCGGYVANLVNAATALGVATIAQAAIAMHSDIVRQELAIPDDRQIVCAVSFGYADLEHPINGFRTSRAALDAAVTRVVG
ncbi:nitroreductase [Microbacterium terrae]|uniref:Coenzyme F420:L-glutamate ligase n=1 Tax=Microbacterium terrae TaxID=69369 RepID=A0A0M2H237_9MICO|nr:nitroreductase [Microbacterium terrae]KJL37514.1 Coenzyme F420:L-glutamate ligase [Microbacterium terrae]MBP1076343.1 nitroreductase [Microbacterium terrae]GLJ97167.1 nitroreductase [Microbacterium terrae]